MPKTDIKREIETRLRNMLVKHLQAQLPKIEAACKQILKAAIESSSTYQSIRQPQGKLRQELGIERPEVIDRITQVFVDSLTATMSVRQKSIVVEVTAVSEYSDLIKAAYHPDGSYITDKGVTIEWVRWLLFMGTQPIVRDFYVKIANSYERESSRTDSLIMRAKQGAFYAIPTEFAGTTENNFITRICQDIGNEVLHTMKRNIA